MTGYPIGLIALGLLGEESEFRHHFNEIGGLWGFMGLAT